MILRYGYYDTMLKMNHNTTPETDESGQGSENTETSEQGRQESKQTNGLLHVVTSLIRGKPESSSLRETIEEYIEETDAPHASDTSSVSAHEKQLLANILKLRDLTAFDVMVPRADIVAVNANTPYEELLSILAEKTYSRLPVYKDNLDNVVGSIHVKDILSALASGKAVEIPALVRDIQIISPSLNVLDLLVQMRLTGKHMVLVIDEYGGIDGLVTIGDVIEAVVGEIDDEHDPDEEPEVQIRADGTVTADARLDLEDFEERFGIELDDEEKEENDTLGGLIFSIAGRVPVRGEVIPHDSGIVFEILEADPRRVSRVCIRNLPKSALNNPDSE